MTRPHRAWHLRIWLVLAPVIVAGLVGALRARPRESPESNPVAGDCTSACCAERKGTP